MNRIELEIKALSPLAIGRNKPGASVSEAEDYIPGSVIRGAIASQLLQTNQPETGDDFHRLFLDENQAIFQNAYPAFVYDKETKTKEIAENVYVLPSTVLSSKIDSGFKPNKNGVFDTLIDRFCAEKHGFPYDPSCPTKPGERVDGFSGFYTIVKGKYYKVSANKRLLTRVGINRRRATSEESILYSIQVLNESQPIGNKPAIYRGSILVADHQLAELLVAFIRSHQEVFRFGGSVSRGLGKVKIQPKLSQKSQNLVKSRIEDFNKKLQKRWQDWNIFSQPEKPYPKARKYFTLDLQSDAILTENWQRTTVISEAMLRELTGLDSSLKLEAAYSSYDHRSGWNSAWGLMKDIELVTNKGGVYLFSISQDQEKEWIDALIQLESQGVGERTSEGFGQVQICNPFHLVLREEAK